MATCTLYRKLQSLRQQGEQTSRSLSLLFAQVMLVGRQGFKAAERILRFFVAVQGSVPGAEAFCKKSGQGAVPIEHAATIAQAVEALKVGRPQEGTQNKTHREE